MSLIRRRKSPGWSKVLVSKKGVGVSRKKLVVSRKKVSQVLKPKPRKLQAKTTKTTTKTTKTTKTLPVKIINPNNGRKINLNGPTHLKLIKLGVLDVDGNKIIGKISNIPKTLPKDFFVDKDDKLKNENEKLRVDNEKLKRENVKLRLEIGKLRESKGEKRKRKEVEKAKLDKEITMLLSRYTNPKFKGVVDEDEEDKYFELEECLDVLHEDPHGWVSGDVCVRVYYDSVSVNLPETINRSSAYMPIYILNFSATITRSMAEGLSKKFKLYMEKTGEMPSQFEKMAKEDGQFM